ncbi:MAG TPA: hypothetical protein VG889_06735 [Rhizomicrobium sp.]|nr:hypothetical protein [Rhizomicrobium sp.]
MKHFTDVSFWDAYHRLPPDIRKLADKNFALLRDNPQHPSLRFKKVGEYWSARIGIHYRALATEAPDGFVWFTIAPHGKYDRLV